MTNPSTPVAGPGSDGGAVCESCDARSAPSASRVASVGPVAPELVSALVWFLSVLFSVLLLVAVVIAVLCLCFGADALIAANSPMRPLSPRDVR